MTSFFDFGACERQARSNSYLVAAEGLCGDRADAPAPVLAARPDAVFAALRSRLEDDGSYRDIVANEGARSIEAVAVTRILRFKDDVSFLVREEPGGTSSVSVYSRSRIGKSDLGANKSRVEDILAALRDDLSGA